MNKWNHKICENFEIFQQKYRGARYSLGYSPCPNLEDQTKILNLLNAKRIGVTLTETFQLIPEESTSAIVVHYPQAKHYLIGTDNWQPSTFMLK